jgi:hypothetical protein
VIAAIDADAAHRGRQRSRGPAAQPPRADRACG